MDLAKVYDRLSWEFILYNLLDMGIPHSLTNVIMKCITTTSIQVLWNGGLSESFLPTRGIRQGDPMSPYIFVLCMERLAHAIDA